MLTKMAATEMNETGVSFKPHELSAHINHMDIEGYDTKLTRLNITDPYNAPSEFFTSIKSATAKDKVPDLQYPDIYNYLINFLSSYSGESLKDYKCLEGYKWTTSGFVTNLQLWCLPAKNSVVITGSVRHNSQKMADPALKPWVLVRNDGVVLGAHCHCTTGRGESCSHVSAVLFSVWQHNNGRQEDSQKCKRCKPSPESLQKMVAKQGKDLNFTHSKVDSSIRLAVPPLTPDEQTQLYSRLSKCCRQDGGAVKPAVLSVVRDYASAYVPKTVMLNPPELLTDPSDNQAGDLILEELPSLRRFHSSGHEGIQITGSSSLLRSWICSNCKAPQNLFISDHPASQC
ncbi:uncharacterized protein LOC133664977 [Entelurus aequoreus]|uniref:uncharacterized protein LOC133664977 n=1 Tax=Entelurus aequoreus TaxID=161455 RepID=UPI002B1DD34E|nr:uncharacterized protein LOC133664977 [Entelurus aequoreus]